MQHTIYHEGHVTDAWHCTCGNTPASDGFYPCDKEGKAQEPNLGWAGNYKCDRCQKVVHLDDVKHGEYCVACKQYVPLSEMPEGDICKKHFPA